MNYYVTEVRTSEDIKKVERHAGGKARADVCDILGKNGFEEIIIKVDANRNQSSIFGKIKKHREIYKKWNNACNLLKNGESIIIQYPIIDHSIFMGAFGKKLKKRGVRIVLLIHDLAMLRTSCEIGNSIAKRQNIEETELLKHADRIIVHNHIMMDLLVQFGISKEKMVSLGIFDYYINDWNEKLALNRYIDIHAPVVIAGNLLKEKAGYVYKLPDNLEYNLYGINYESEEKSNISYKGSFLPDDLPYELEGSFGLVWDGEEITTCKGVFGEYLKYNNPHKTSLYLASELPVIIWKEAALASFIVDNNLGIVVESIDDISKELEKVSLEYYKDMRHNVSNIAEKLRTGYYTMKAITESLNN